MPIDLEKEIEKGLEKLNSPLKEWVIAHLIQPRTIKLYTGFSSDEQQDFWLITDHIGNNDSSYRVVYSKERNSFGLEVEMENGRNVMMGFYGDFATATESM